MTDSRFCSRCGVIHYADEFDEDQCLKDRASEIRDEIDKIALQKLKQSLVDNPQE